MKCGAEHVHERAFALIAELYGKPRQVGPDRQALQCTQSTRALAPLTERGSGVVFERTHEAAFGHLQRAGPVCKRAVIARRMKQRLEHALDAGTFGKAQLDRPAAGVDDLALE